VKDEYDFSVAEQGKFFQDDAQAVPPIHLEADVLQYLLRRAEARGSSLSELVNSLLRKDIELIEAGR